MRIVRFGHVRIPRIIVLCCLPGVEHLHRWIEHFRTQWLEGGRGSGLQRKMFCINYMSSTCAEHLESQDQTLQRRARVHDVFYSICNGRRKVFCIECYTCMYVRIRSSCQVQLLQQRDAQRFLILGGNILHRLLGSPVYPHFNVGYALTHHLQHVNSSSLRL